MELYQAIPQVGKVEWIGIRPNRREAVVVVEQVQVDAESGLAGDRYSGKAGGKRMVTLIQSEHLQVIASILKRESIDPADLRRNIVVSGINLLALKAPGKELEFQVGDAILKMTGRCHPCSRMEENLGHGGFNAMRGHGGITASVVRSGTVAIGSDVHLIPSAASSK